jgi:hypothetical protein
MQHSSLPEHVYYTNADTRRLSLAALTVNAVRQDSRCSSCNLLLTWYAARHGRGRIKMAARPADLAPRRRVCHVVPPAGFASPELVGAPAA